MRDALFRLRQAIGIAGLGGLALLAAAGAIYMLVLQPLGEKSRGLDSELRRAPRAVPAATPDLGKSPRRLGAFYEYFERPERVEDWLSKLYASALAADLEWRTAEYRVLDSRYRLTRYQISFPITGSYHQIRVFIERALVEIPVMSVDQLAFRRKSVNESRVAADVVLTLYLPAP